MATDQRTPIPHPFADDRVHEECGVFGIYGTTDAAAHTALGLHALQHRGQEAAGIVSYDGRQFHSERHLGLVADAFSSQSVIDRLRGHCAVGHNRYATTGETVLRNVQPLFAEFAFGGLAVAHNGNLTNGLGVRQRLTEQGSIFQSTTDTEAIVHLIATSSHKGVIERLIDALRQVEGAYSFVVLTKDTLIGVRDPLGVRPLVIGRLDGATILPPRPVRSTSSAPSSCGASIPARWWWSMPAVFAACFRSRPPRSGSACSS